MPFVPSSKLRWQGLQQTTKIFANIETDAPARGYRRTSLWSKSLAGREGTIRHLHALVRRRYLSAGNSWSRSS